VTHHDSVDHVAGRCAQINSRINPIAAAGRVSGILPFVCIDEINNSGYLVDPDGKVARAGPQTGTTTRSSSRASMTPSSRRSVGSRSAG
jgi:hypothetical protein